MLGIVVVRRADIPISGPVLFHRFDKPVRRSINPRSITSNPVPRNIIMQRFRQYHGDLPGTVPMMILPNGSIPEAERMGSIWAMPASWPGRAKTRHKNKVLAEFVPTMPIPAINP
jgi:hypothetical protein